MNVLVLDNYDSFTFNLVQYLGELGAEPTVVRNDKLPPAEAAALEPDRLVISPGPGRPEDAGFSVEYVRQIRNPGADPWVFVWDIQAIVVAFGGSVARAPEPRHGKTSEIAHDGAGVYTGLENPFVATRYHSLAVHDIPGELQVTAQSEDGVIQGVRHRTLPIEGVQFHPESIMTAQGMALLKNFLGS